MTRAIITGTALLLSFALSGCATGSRDIAVRALVPPEMAQEASGADPLAAGRAFLAQGNFGLAISAFRQAIEVDPRSAAAHNGLAVVYVELGRPDLARRHFGQAVTLAPANAVYGRNLARLERDHRPNEAPAPDRLAQAPMPDPARVTYAIRTVPSSAINVTASGSRVRLTSIAPGISILATPDTRAQRPVVRASAAQPGNRARLVMRPGTQLQPALERVSEGSVRLNTRIGETIAASAPKTRIEARSTFAIQTRTQPLAGCRPDRSYILPATALTVDIADCVG